MTRRWSCRETTSRFGENSCTRSRSRSGRGSPSAREERLVRHSLPSLSHGGLILCACSRYWNRHRPYGRSQEAQVEFVVRPHSLRITIPSPPSLRCRIIACNPTLQTPQKSPLNPLALSQIHLSVALREKRTQAGDTSKGSSEPKNPTSHKQSSEEQFRQVPSRTTAASLSTKPPPRTRARSCREASSSIPPLPADPLSPPAHNRTIRHARSRSRLGESEEVKEREGGGGGRGQGRKNE